MNILIVEDEINLARQMEDYLSSLGHTCLMVHDKFKALDQMLVSSFDILILDINLPDGSGLDVLKWIKDEKRHENIIIVSARDSLDDRISGLDLGADDYLTKPFHMAELSSRINAISRRQSKDGTSMIELHEVKIDTLTMEAYVNENRLDLTKTEYDLLRYFILNKNRVLPKRVIAGHIWQDEFIGAGGDYNFMYLQIRNLRKKIKVAGGNDYLRTVHGVGYKYSVVS